MGTSIDLTLLGKALADFRGTIFSVFSANTGYLQETGLHLFKVLAIAMIVMSGLRIAFGADQNYTKLAHYFLMISIAFVMITYYSSPIPGFGGSGFAQIIPNEGFVIADKIGMETQKEMSNALMAILRGLDQGLPFRYVNPQDMTTYFLIQLLVALLQFALFVIVAFGYLAIAVVMLFGPLLVPWIIVPKLDFLFWGWFKSLIKYSFYTAVANAVLFLICRLMLAVLYLSCGFSPGALTMKITGATLAWLALTFCAGIYCAFKVPTLANDLFSGSAVSGSAAGVEAAVRTVVAGAF
jgi:hypothetical protein